MPFSPSVRQSQPKYVESVGISSDKQVSNRSLYYSQPLSRNGGERRGCVGKRGRESTREKRSKIFSSSRDERTSSTLRREGRAFFTSVSEFRVETEIVDATGDTRLVADRGSSTDEARRKRKKKK